MEQLSETVLAEVSTGFSLSIVGVDYEGIGSRIKTIREHLESYVNHTPQSTVDELFAMTEALTPDFVPITVSAELFSSLASGSFWVKLPIHTWMEEGKNLLEKAL